MSIRPALPSDAPRLSDLALASKAHWGYDEAFIESCRAELTVSAEDIDADPTYVAEIEGAIAGFYLLRPAADGGSAASAAGGTQAGARIDFFYVAADLIGRGIGARLMRHLLAEARRRGYKELIIHSDPHAEPFYRAFGAVRVGDVASGSIPGRRLPLLRIELR